MSHYVIGVDGGGTKTEFVLLDFSGNVIGKFKGEATNYQVVGGERLKEELIKGFAEITKITNVSLNRISSIFLGLAGAGRKTDQEEIIALFADTDFAAKIFVDSDAMVALAGAFGTSPGIIVISGTGAICFGKNSTGEIIRSGGWGYLLGDEGSGYFMGREAVIAALKDMDGRGEKTKLRNRIEEHLNISAIDQVIPQIYQNKIDRVAIADLARIVFELANQGDLIAEQIVRRTGQELGLLAKAVAHRLDFENNEIKVALIGSVFKQKDILINEISKELYEISWNVEISDPMFEPQYGAALLALQKSEIEINETLLKNIKYSIHQNGEM